jgi:cell division protein FtsB
MTEAKWDFREGLLLQKAHYKDESCKFGEGILFFGVIILTWIWGLAWFCLFFWMYIYHQPVSFWIFIGVFLVHFITLIIIGVYTIISSKNKKRQKKIEKEQNDELINRIEKSKKISSNQNKNIINNNNDNYNHNNNDNNSNNIQEIINTETKMLKTNENE